MKLIHTKKFRHGSVSLALTVVIVAAVILLNAIVSAIGETKQWYIDMTPEPLFTLSDKAKGVLTEAVETAPPSTTVTILFCDEADAWESTKMQSQVHQTALELQNTFPDVIRVEHKDVFTNPSAFNDYSEERTGEKLTSTSVVITSGTEARVYQLNEFFSIDQKSSTVKGYDGEFIYVSAILSVTRAESPLLCVTKNHGEEMSDPALLSLMESVGFKIQTIDLSKEELPEDCRLLLIFDPKQDFLERDSAAGGYSDVSEIDKIEAFLDKQNSLMVFVDKDTPVLPNLETLLAEWGIAISRDLAENYMIQDKASSLDFEGFYNKAIYETTGTGADITAQMRKQNHFPTVLFPNATALRFSSRFTERPAEGYAYMSDGVSDRTCYKVFTSSEDAVAMANGEVVATAKEKPFSYMLLSCRVKAGTQETSFVLAASSTEFATAAALDSKYGNHAVLSYACNTMGSLTIPVDVDCKYYASTEMTAITASAAKQYTVVLTVVPTVIVFIAGIYVMVRRKYA